MEKTGYDFEKGRIKARDDALKEKITPDQKENVKKIGFGLLAFHLSGFFIGFAFIIIFVILAFTISRKAINSMHTDEYNSPLIHYKGVKELASTRWLLEKVNDKLVDDKHKLIVLYNNEDYKTVEEVSKLKDSLEDGSYKITFSYDKSGYINKVIIDKVNY